MRSGSTTVRLLVAALVALVVILVSSLIVASTSTGKDVTYEEYIGHLEAGQVASVTRDNTTGDITFTLADDPSTEISTTGPRVEFEDEFDLLNQIPTAADGSGGVTFLTQRRGLAQVLFFLLPIAALAGIVIVIGALIAITVLNQQRPPKT